MADRSAVLPDVNGYVRADAETFVTAVLTGRVDLDNNSDYYTGFTKTHVTPGQKVVVGQALGSK